jgi:MSHA pilin protein MshA
MKQQSGFTLIELVVVIVLLGILGAAATAKFQDLSVSAGNAAAAGVAGELGSASAINYAAFQTGVATASDVDSGSVCDVANADMQNLMQQGGFPTQITLAAGADTCGASGEVMTCLVSHSNGDTAATATLLCTGG